MKSGTSTGTGCLSSQPTEKLEVSVESETERITLSVPARAYSAEEIEEAFSAAIEALDEIILGENLSFHTVNRNMIWLRNTRKPGGR